MLCQYHLCSCAGAYILLAEEEATNVSDALELFAKGAEAGERHLRKLNPHYFTHHQADFWMSMPTCCSPNLPTSPFNPNPHHSHHLAPWFGCKRAEHVDPAEPETRPYVYARRRMGMCLAKLGRYEEAVKIFSVCVAVRVQCERPHTSVAFEVHQRRLRF
jgi:hypothetical protein